MKLPSVASLAFGTIATFRRFPLAIIAAIFNTVILIWVTHMAYNEVDILHWCWNMIMSGYLGMLLCIAIVVYVERKGWGTPAKTALQWGGACMAVAYYYSLPDHFQITAEIRFFLFALGLHLAIAFVGFMGKGEENGFWQYNKGVFLRILNALLYTSVLYLGLLLALVAIDKLFKADVNSNVYTDLWWVLIGLFNTWFFLAGFPDDYPTLDRKTDYPKGLKIFTQYVLLPILAIYLLILYAYMGKIIFTAQWPVGWVSYLVLGFSVAGILSLLLIYPVRNEENNKWILTFSHFFYFALFPLIVLLCFAIERRVSDYGITELRYFVLLLAAWLLFMAIYFLVPGKKNIKLIPVSLCMLAFLSSFGPWGAFQVSRRSQLSQFTRLLEKNRILVNGKAVRADHEPPFADRKQISSVMDYLIDTHGYQVLQPYFTQNLDSLVKHDSLSDNRYSNGQVGGILALMNMTYLYRYSPDDSLEREVSYFNDNSAKVMEVRGYEYVINDYAFASSENETVDADYTAGEDSIHVRYDTSKHRLNVFYRADLSLHFEMDSVYHSLLKKGYNSSYNPVSPKDVTVYDTNGILRGKMVLRNIYGGAEKGVSGFNGDIYIGRKK